MVRGIGPAYGFQPQQDEGIRVWNRTSVTLVLGDVVQLNLSQAGSETTDNTVGTQTSGFGNVIEAVDELGGVYGVVTDLLAGAGADNTEVVIGLRGLFDVRLLNGDTHIGKGFAVQSSAQTVTHAEGVTDAKIVAISLADPGADTAVLTACWFDGINGFGHDTTT